MIALDPSGRLLDDALVDELAAEPALTLLCGRYEGFDERVLEHFTSDRVSIGRYVLAGGSCRRWCCATRCCASSRARSGTSDSALEESFSAALEGGPEYPHYTRPGRVSGLARARGAAVGPSRSDRAVAAASRAADRAGPPERGSRPASRARAPRRDRARGAVRYHRPPHGRARAIGASPSPDLARAEPLAMRIAGVCTTMSTVIDSLERTQLRRVPAFDAGDRLRVHFQVIEGTRRRTQVFEGVVIKRQGHGARETFTVRKQSFGVGVERTFPLHSPKIERIEVAARGDVRRAKLYYLRDRIGKRARVRERRSAGPEVAVERELLYGPEDGAEARRRDVGRRGRAVRRGRRGRPVEATAEPASASRASPRPRRAATSPRPLRPTPSRRPAKSRCDDARKPLAVGGRAGGDRRGRARPRAWRSRPSSSSPTRSRAARCCPPCTSTSGSWWIGSAPTSRRPHVGDILVFHPPASEIVRQLQPGARTRPVSSARPRVTWRSDASPSQTYIKRVVGLPGDRLSIRGGHVYPQRRPGAGRVRRAVRGARASATSRPRSPSRGRLLHDGRQSAGLAGQPVLGPCAKGLDHR